MYDAQTYSHLYLKYIFPFRRTLMKQLNPVEKYAFNHVEHIQKFWKDYQIAAIDAEIEAQKKEFDEKKLEEMAEAIGAGASATPTEDGSTASVGVAEAPAPIASAISSNFFSSNSFF
jgi:hypothetical protein